MSGKVYCVGTGPGDPELMTLKAVRLLRENDVIAVPGRMPEQSAAFRIAVQAVPDIREKTLVGLPMPMTSERDVLAECHSECAAVIRRFLDGGRNVVLLTLGDPSLYSTMGYVVRLLAEEGYVTETISGVPSFCAAAARLAVPLAEWDESLHILPALHAEAGSMKDNGNYVLMKSASRMRRVKRLLMESGKAACAVENCGLPDERIYRSAEAIPDDAGYFTVIIAKSERAK